jgi:hypothetical protein
MQPEPFCSELGGGARIAGPELDPGGLEGGDVREQDSPATLRQLPTHFGEDLSRLVESTEHRQCPGPIGTEEVVPPCSRLVLVEPHEQFGRGGHTEEAK